MDHVTTSERIDDLPLLVSLLRQMRVDSIIDEGLGPPHGNWSGLSSGEVAIVFLTHILMSCTHFLSPVQEWIAQHQVSLSHALGKPVRPQDGTDDRLAVLLSRLGKAGSGVGQQIERDLGRHLVRAYALPRETVRIDMTSVSVHHKPKDESGLLHFGHSKDHRPDLRQFKEALGPLDPCGIPLATATLSGEQADDPNYLPVWERMVSILERTDFLVVGDCKVASLSNRAHIQRHGFHRLKGGLLAITPLYLRDDDRLRGLLLVLGIALRVLTLSEFVVRQDLAVTGEKLKGLYEGNPNRATDQPTGERLLKAFHNITLYRHQTPERVWYEVTPLSFFQRRILSAMGMPETIYNTPPAPLIRSG